MLLPLVVAWPNALAAGTLASPPRTIVHGDLGFRNVVLRFDSPIIFDRHPVGLADPAYEVLQLDIRIVLSRFGPHGRWSVVDC